MILNETKLDFNDLNIVPKITTPVDTRKDCTVVYGDEFLPLFAAPMDTVVSLQNIDLFKKNQIHPIIPRNGINQYDYESPEDSWVAIGMDTFYALYVRKGDTIPKGKEHFICVDIANGHMHSLIEDITRAKHNYGDRLNLMVGNIANPETYKELSNAGADYIRVGIGNGAGCLTTLNTGVGYPMGSLINEVYEISTKIKHPANIVADGGMQNYSDIIKALALGADYVMVGSIFNKALESAGATFKEVITRDGNREVGEHVDQYSEQVRIAFTSGARFYKNFRGMSTKDVQRELGNTTIRTSEGVSRMRLVEYTLSGWVENFVHYLSTAMSYTGHKNINHFIGEVDLVPISNNSFIRYNK